MIHRRKPNRLSEYDYSQRNAYFVTIVIRNREKIFGEIVSGKMILNDYGEIAERCWRGFPEHITGCASDEFIIMPDHLHGIVVVGENPESLNSDPQYKKLPVVIGSYKSAVSKLIHQSGHPDFRWQKSYWDRIIGNEEELNRIRNYIIRNPENYPR